MPILTTFDEEVENAFFEVISPSCSQERMQRARLKASLPAPWFFDPEGRDESRHRSLEESDSRLEER